MAEWWRERQPDALELEKETSSLWASISPLSSEECILGLTSSS